MEKITIISTWKKITGEEAIDLIESAAAIIVHDGNDAVTYPSVEQPDEDKFWNVDISYMDADGDINEYGFKIWGDDQIDVKDNKLELLNSETGEYVPVSILQLQTI